MRKTLLSSAFVAASAASAALSISQQASAQVVISEVYGGGGYTTGTAAFANDFVVLYNNGNTAVDLSTWALQYSSVTAVTATSTANNFNVFGFTSGSTIAPSGYFLIKGGSGSVGTAFPTASTNQPAQPFFDDDLSTTGGINVTFGLSISGTGAQIALTNNTTPLTVTYTGNVYGATAPAGYASIVDFVGFGNTTAAPANRYEGSPSLAGIGTSTAATTNNFRTYSLSRTYNGTNSTYTDTNNNNTDFALAQAVLYNSKGDVFSNATPEPAVLLLMGAGMTPVGLSLRRRKVCGTVPKRGRRPKELQDPWWRRTTNRWRDAALSRRV